MACEQEFDDATYEDCTALWTKLMRTVFAMSEEDAATRGADAAVSCPNAPDEPAAQHSAYSNASAIRVQRLRELDRAHLDGMLHAYEAAVPCAVSARYKLVPGLQRSTRLRRK